MVRTENVRIRHCPRVGVVGGSGGSGSSPPCFHFVGSLLFVSLFASGEGKLFFVTTEKVAGRVLVQIEPAQDSSTQEGY